MMSRSADQLRRRWSGVSKRGSDGQIGPAEQRLQARPQRGGAAGLEREVPAAHREDAHGRARGALRLAAVQHRGVGDVVGRDQGLQHRDVEVGALTGAIAAAQGGQDRAEGVGAGQHVGGLEVRRARRRLVALVEVHHPGGRVDDVGEGLALAPRAGLAEARDRAVDEIGLDRGHRGVAQAELLDDAGGEVLDEDVGDPAEIGDDPAALRVAQVHRDAFLAHVDADEVGGLVGAARLDLEVVLPHVVALARPLDLDHARAQVGEQARAVGAGEHAGEIEDDQIREWAGDVAHRASIAR